MWSLRWFEKPENQDRNLDFLPNYNLYELLLGQVPMTEHENKAFQNILDCFSGTDGGVGFIQFKGFLEGYSKTAAEGDEASKQLLAIMLQFNRMIEIAKGN